jgi:hypothetical protein
VRPVAAPQELEEEAKRADKSAYEEVPSDGEQRKRKGVGKSKAPPPGKKAKH